jgi:hypothetical protein
MKENPFKTWLECLAWLVKQLGPLDNTAREFAEARYYSGWHPARIWHALDRGYWKSPTFPGARK